MMVGLYEGVGGGFVCSSSHQGRHRYLPSENARSARFEARDAMGHAANAHFGQDRAARRRCLGKTPCVAGQGEVAKQCLPAR
jgi:hypothetical protein